MYRADMIDPIASMYRADTFPDSLPGRMAKGGHVPGRRVNSGGFDTDPKEHSGHAVAAAARPPTLAAIDDAGFH